MKSADRMFRVIVAGGIALAGSGPAATAGCGGTVASQPARDGGGTEGDASPAEGSVPIPDDAFPTETATYYDAFPVETAPAADAFFPTEGPAMIDSGIVGDAMPQDGAAPDSPPPVSDASAVVDGSGPLPDGFPQETAQP